MREGKWTAIIEHLLDGIRVWQEQRDHRRYNIGGRAGSHGTKFSDGALSRWDQDRRR
ncbi:MAG: hypothetical protein VX733_12370 [Candidatus Latescibacterota bacterium]|nr:hypothetical protein [Candidatus Latescibacterota bacterium]